MGLGLRVYTCIPLEIALITTTHELQINLRLSEDGKDILLLILLRIPKIPTRQTSELTKVRVDGLLLIVLLLYGLLYLLVLFLELFLLLLLLF